MRSFFVFATVLSSIIYAGCQSSNASNDPKETLSQFFLALSKKDMAKVKTLSTKESQSMISMMESAMNSVKDKSADDKFDPSQMQYGEPKIDGDKAIVPVKENKTGETLNYTLKKEDGSWKVAFDKESVINMSMDKMNEKGVNASDSIQKAMQELRNMNIDSLKQEMQGAIDSAAEELKKKENQN